MLNEPEYPEQSWSSSSNSLQIFLSIGHDKIQIRELLKITGFWVNFGHLGGILKFIIPLFEEFPYTETQHWKNIDIEVQKIPTENV